MSIITVPLLPSKAMTLGLPAGRSVKPHHRPRTDHPTDPLLEILRKDRRNLEGADTPSASAAVLCGDGGSEPSAQPRSSHARKEEGIDRRAGQRDAPRDEQRYDKGVGVSTPSGLRNEPGWVRCRPWCCNRRWS